MSKKKKIAIAWLCLVLTVLVIGTVMGNQAMTGILIACAVFAVGILTITAIAELLLRDGL